MNAERWKQIDQLFAAVLEVPESERDAFLAEKCGADAALRDEVLSLLNAHPRVEGFLEKPAIEVAAAGIAAGGGSGRFVGPYEIERQIGAGGMGEVFLAWDAKLRRKVALKILPAEYTASDERVKRFQLEAKAVSILNHPNIVTIFDIGTTEKEGVNYIATEYVEGRTLRELIGRGTKPKDVVGIVVQVCEALAAAHSAGIVHRDIKPENIIVRPDGYVKVLDFGLAKLSRERAGGLEGSARGALIGTPAYMSPVQVGGEAVDHRTDLWSVGVVMYELLTGVNPFKKENRLAAFRAILNENPPRPGSLSPDVSPELDHVVVKALEKDPELGYQSATDLRADLRRVRRALDLPPAAAAVSASAPARAGRRRFVAGVAALALLTAIGGAWWIYASRGGAGRAPVVRNASEWEGAKNVQLTVSPWVEGYPSISPDGKDIVFASEIEGDGNIYRQRIGGTTQSNLTPGSKERDTMPAFSPDGKLIAFRSEREPSGIYVMGETGENPRRVSDVGYHPSWSPDQRKIVVSDRFSAIHTAHVLPDSSLWIIDPAGGEKKRIDTGGRDAIMPSWSPHGHRIAFWFVEGGNSGEIATVPADGGEPVVIASNAAADWNPVWSPDGRYVYFASNRKGNMSFWRVPVDEQSGRQMGEPEVVSTPSKYCRHLAFSADGKVLAYVRYESKSNLRSIEFDPKTLQTRGEAEWITRGNNEIGNPQMSPDGGYFVVRNPDNTQENLVVFDRVGGGWRRLTEDGFRERFPRWSPDGTKIAFHSDRSGKFQIWMIDADGSNLRQVTFSDKQRATNAVFSPDGRRLVYTEDDGISLRLQMLDLDGPEAAPKILPPPPPEAFPDANPRFSARDWSRDGKKLLVSRVAQGGEENGIAVFDFETGRYAAVVEFGATPVWLADGRNFIFTTRNTVFRGDSLTGKVAELYRPAAFELQHAGISPDNRMIFFRYLEVDADVWLLDASPQPEEVKR